jgi:hypothetical protein
VPIVAITFDCYFVSEDFGVKRIGAFLARTKSGVSQAERDWESAFVHTHNNPFAAYAFAVVSLVLLTGAAILLSQRAAPWPLLAAWFFIASRPNWCCWSTACA